MRLEQRRELLKGTAINADDAATDKVESEAAGEEQQEESASDRPCEDRGIAVGVELQGARAAGPPLRIAVNLAAVGGVAIAVEVIDLAGNCGACGVEAGYHLHEGQVVAVVAAHATVLVGGQIGFAAVEDVPIAVVSILLALDGALALRTLCGTYA